MRRLITRDYWTVPITEPRYRWAWLWLIFWLSVAGILIDLAQRFA